MQRMPILNEVRATGALVVFLAALAAGMLMLL